MASSSKRRTTMAKITRERAVQEKRARKQEKKEERKEAAAAAAAGLAEGADSADAAEPIDEESAHDDASPVDPR